MTVNQLYGTRAWEARIQRQLDRISKKLYRVSANYAQQPALYWVEARCWAWLYGQRWAQQRYWPEKVDVIHTFLRATKLLDHNPSLTIDLATQKALFGSCFFQHWVHQFATWPPQQLAQVITVHGWERWVAAHQRGQGVILTHYHAHPTKLVWIWLAAMGVQNLTTITKGRVAAQAAGVAYRPEIAPFLHARQLHAAKACLEAGGVVRILPDGFNGKEGLSLPLYHHMQSFRTSFAELALRTGASVMPVSTMLDLRGKVEITFHAPLALPDRQQASAAQIEQLVGQYVTFLHDIWAKAPAAIGVEYMKRFLEQATPI